MSEIPVVYEAQRPVVELNEGIIKKYICPQATEQEIYLFLQLCKGQQLNPFLREAYLIKYGSQPASMVTGKDTFIKRARSISTYKGFRAGVVIANAKNEVCYREGGIVIKGETLIGGWSEVFRADCEVPIRAEVAFDEYVAKKTDGTINQQWTTKPATMIRKVALVQAHREAFPDQFEGLYSPEEMGIEVTSLPEYSTDSTAPGYVSPPQQKQPAEQSGEQPKTVITTIDDVTRKAGKTKDGKDYTRYIIKTPEGEFSTFSETLSAAALTASTAGKRFKITYTESRFGKDAVSGQPVEATNGDEGNAAA